jgi:hypothetical protein
MPQIELRACACCTGPSHKELIMTTFSTTHAGLERLLAGTRFLSDAFAPVFDPASPTASLKRVASRVSQSVLQWAERHAQSRADEAYWRIARSNPEMLSDLRAAVSRAEDR